MTRRTTYDETRTVRGYHFGIRYERDEYAGPPWAECDGHGPVSVWRERASKGPGEWVLSRDRNAIRFYDAEEAQRIALRDGWNTPPYDVPGETRRQRAARAVEADFLYLRAWCRDEWQYVGVIVTWIDAAGLPRAPETQESLWNVETWRDYHRLVADDLIAECLARIEVETPDAVLSEN